MKKLMSFILAGTFVIAPLAEAKTIGQIMQENGAESADAGAQRAALFTSIRGRLSAKRDIPALETILATGLYNDSNPISSSFFFKEYLNGASDAILRSLRYGVPVAIDPSMSIEEYQKKLDRRESQLCINAINMNGYTADGKNSEIDQLLSRIMKNLSQPASKRRAGVPQKLTQEESRVVAILRQHVSQAPQVAGIRKVLGDVHDLALYNNRIRRVQFSFEADKSYRSDILSGSKKVDLQLSMLVSIRTGQDEAFVKIQNCLVEYLKAQEKAFGNRLGEIHKGSSGLKASAAVFADAGLTGIKTGPTKFDAVAKSQQKAYQLKYFFEGKQGFTSLKEEEDFIVTRLVKIQATLPYLQGRLEGALTAHKALIQLKPAQLDYLIDMMLQLNRDNLPLATDVTALRALAQSADTSTAQGRANFEAFVYFRQVARDLVSLSEALDVEKARNEARTEDRRALQQLRR